VAVEPPFCSWGKKSAESSAYRQRRCRPPLAAPSNPGAEACSLSSPWSQRKAAPYSSFPAAGRTWKYPCLPPWSSTDKEGGSRISLPAHSATTLLAAALCRRLSLQEQLLQSSSNSTRQYIRPNVLLHIVLFIDKYYSTFSILLSI
jgi:hypothetical protein